MKEFLAAMSLVESRLAEVNAKLPAIPKEFRDLLIKAAPYFVLLAIALTSVGLYHLLSVYFAWNDTFGAFASYSGMHMGMGVWGWVRIGFGIAGIAILATAVSGLFATSRTGWERLFYAQCLATISSVLFFEIPGLFWAAV